ncbi:MAG: SufE family protein [Methylacidiphilales bacterium]|nr:SufE family protein [Candidatus Methylacidiphilales bacterium]MDW8348856.1 Fe-S metabolism protein SufE [Verrucomicrobiae bacterium]
MSRELESATSCYPEKLNKIVQFFQGLSDEERRENLINYADSAKRYAPREGMVFDLEDVRKDEECTDTVGIFLKIDPVQQGAHFYVSLGPEVQTLTRAMTAILCKGLDNEKPETVLDVPADFVPKIVGAELVRLRSQTSYYVLGRMKAICKAWLDRERMKQQEKR